MTQRTTSWNAPYTFSGKEKDVETGYGYFGARYYDSGLSIWLSVDPMSDKYPSMSPYNYCANNPVILVDPDGREFGDFVDGDGNYLGTDGINDGKIYFVSNHKSQQLIKKNDRKGINTSSSDDRVKVDYETTVNILCEAVDVFDRTTENGGDKEESTVLIGNESYIGKTGTKEKCTFPKNEGDVSIHSHPFTIEAGMLSTTEASGDDRNVFPYYKVNIIVGKTNIDPNSFVPGTRYDVMTFYGQDRTLIPQFQINMDVARKIVNRTN